MNEPMHNNCECIWRKISNHFSAKMLSKKIIELSDNHHIIEVSIYCESKWQKRWTKLVSQQFDWHHAILNSSLSVTHCTANDFTNEEFVFFFSKMKMQKHRQCNSYGKLIILFSDLTAAYRLYAIKHLHKEIIGSFRR